MNIKITHNLNEGFFEIEREGFLFSINLFNKQYSSQLGTTSEHYHKTMEELCFDIFRKVELLKSVHDNSIIYGLEENPEWKKN